MSRQADRIRERIRQDAGKKAGLYADFAERLIDGEEYAALSERYTKEAEALSAELEKLLEERERYARDFHIEEGWEKTVRGFLGERELTQGMVDAFVTRVSVDKDGDCEVVLAYDDMLAELLEAVREREAENGEG
jgi:phage host-nuclease inhibitor protein Gam